MVSGLGFFALLAVGLSLITLEAILFSFVIMWFGVGFVFVAFLQLVYPVESLLIQVAIASIVALLFLIFFRKKMLVKFQKSEKEIKDDFFNQAGIGEVKNSMVFYKGTFWEFEDHIDRSDYKDGTKVEIVGVKNNRVLIKEQ